jgi:hypothetical protein
MPTIIPATELEPAPPRLAAVQGPCNEAIQKLFAELALMWRAAGLRVAGVLEQATALSKGDQVERTLFDITTGARYPISQALGAGSESCRIDTSGFAAACGSVEEAVRNSCSLVIISKFGKLEMEGGGMKSAFHAAILAGVPVVTSVPSYAEDVWTIFSGYLSVFMTPDREAIESWRIAVARADARSRSRLLH